MRNGKRTKMLVEGALMIAFATVLSLVKLAEMPYGGSVTLASMLPMVILSYRHGVGFGLGCGAVYATLQQLLGLNTLSYVTTWQSVVAVILMDYLLAFVFVGIGGIFRGRLGTDIKSQARELSCGMLLVCFIRYALHTLAGATVWAGLSIPTEAALIYSIGYNATYMIPEAIINVLVAGHLGGIIDFTKPLPTRAAIYAQGDGDAEKLRRNLRLISTALISLGVIFASIVIFPTLQHPEDGSFTTEFLHTANFTLILLVSTPLIIAGIITAIVSALKGRK